MIEGTTPNEQRKQIELLGRELRSQQSVSTLRAGLIELSQGVKSDNPYIASAALIEMGRVIDTLPFTLDQETIGAMGSSIVAAVREGLPDSGTVNPKNYLWDLVGKLTALSEDAHLADELAQCEAPIAAVTPSKIVDASNPKTPLGYTKEFTFGNPGSSRHSGLGEEIEDATVIAIETIPTVRDEYKETLDNIKKILGHDLEQLVAVTKHGKITSQFFDGVHFIQLPIISFNPDPNGHYLLSKKDLTVLVSDKGIVVIEPEGSRFTSRAHEEFLTRGIQNASAQSHQAFAVHLFQSVIDNNKETLANLELRTRRLLTRSEDLQGKRETETVQREKRRLRQAIDYVALQSEESSIDLDILRACLNGHLGNDGLQARLQMLGSSMHSLAKSAQNDKSLLTEIDSNIERSDKARVDASLIKLTVPVTVSAVWVTIDVPLKLMHEHKPEWILAGIAGTAISIAWGLIMINRKRK